MARVSGGRSGVLVILLLLGPASSGLAQTPPPDAPVAPAAPSAPAAASQQAEALIRSGNDAYRVHGYRAALELYRQAHALEGSATTVFNLAQCHRQLGELVRALELYRQYLREWPDAPKRQTAERLIRQLENRRGALLPAPGLESAVSVPVASETAAVGGSRPWYRRWYVWTAIGLAVAGGAVAGAVVATRPSASTPVVQGVTNLGPIRFPAFEGGR